MLLCRRFVFKLGKLGAVDKIPRDVIGDHRL